MTERYPSDVELKTIEEWQGTPRELVEFIGSIWAYRSEHDWVIRRGRDLLGRKVWKVDFSTWGWSGNEDIVCSLEGTWFWLHNWWSSRRGGHYQLQISPTMIDMKMPESIPEGWGKINSKDKVVA
jgi:hypothetical protein